MNRRALTNQEKRTIRFAAIGIGIYLAVFCGFKLWQKAERNRSEYQRLVLQAKTLKEKIAPYETKALALEKLMKDFNLDPAQLSRTSIVAQASAAIQKAAGGSGLQVGPVRELPARSSGKELASVQVEANGPVPAVLSFLHRLERLGYPLVIDSVSLNPDMMRQGQIKLNLTISILDFEQWKAEGDSNA